MLIREPIFLPNKGIKLDSPEQFLLDQISPYSRNMEYRNDLLQGRLGLAKFDSYAFPDPVTFIRQFWKFSAEYDLIVGTNRDLAKYDFGNSRFDFLTPIYNTGTIEVQAGTPTILRGSGTSWLANAKAGDFVKIGAGNYHSGSTFYEVESVDSDTLITLTSAAPTTPASTAYVLRKTFAGGDNDFWDATQFIDGTLGNVLLVTNNVDYPHYYAGSNQFALFSAYPTDFTTCKFIRNFGNCVHFIRTVEGGNNCPVRVRWSAPGDFQTYDDLDYEDLDQPDPQYWFNGALVIGNIMYLLKDNGAYKCRAVASVYEFDFEFSSTFDGVQSPFSVTEFKSGIGYFGKDDRFHYFNEVNDEPVFEDIIPYLENLSPTEVPYIYVGEKKERNQFRWLLPYDSINTVQPMVVYDHKNDVIEIWEYEIAKAIKCIGSFENESDLYVDDPTWGEYYVDEQSGFWDDRYFLSGAPVMLYGGADGYIYKADQTLQDSGVDYNRIFRTKRLDHGKPDALKRMWRQEWWLDAETAGSVTVKISRNDSGSFDAQTKTISLIDATKDVIKKQITWDKEYDVGQYQLEATNHFALHGFLNWIFPKKKRVP